MRPAEALLFAALVFGCQISFWVGRVSMAREIRRTGQLPEHLRRTR